MVLGAEVGWLVGLRAGARLYFWFMKLADERSDELLPVKRAAAAAAAMADCVGLTLLAVVSRLLLNDLFRLTLCELDWPTPGKLKPPVLYWLWLV